MSVLLFDNPREAKDAANIIIFLNIRQTCYSVVYITETPAGTTYVSKKFL
jgi:hypothetical protein